MQQVDWSDLFDFLSSLSTHRFAVGVDQLNEVQQLLVELAIRSKIPPQNELAGLLAPIICRSREEQHLFHSLFARWLQITGSKTPFTPSTDSSRGKTESEVFARRRSLKSPSWYWVIAPLLVISASILTLLLSIPRRPPIILSNSAQQVISGKVTTSEATQPLAGAKVSARKAPSDNDKPVAADAPIVANAITSNDGSYTLRLSDADFPASVEVEYAGYQTGSKRVKTSDRSSEINFSLMREVPWTWLDYGEIGTGTLVILIVAFVLLHRTRRLHLRKWRTANQLQIDQLIVKASSEWLPQLLSLRRSAQNLRQRLEIGSAGIDAEHTVTSTIKSGLFTPVYKVSKSAPEYLVLINRRSASDEVANFADEIVSKLIGDGVYIDRYYYDGDPELCWNPDRIDRSFTLDDLSTIYPDHNLIIFDDGSTLFNPITGVLRQSFEAFGERSVRALLTHDFPLDEYRYRALFASNMFVVPTNAKGLAALAERASGGHSQPLSRDDRPQLLPPLLRERPVRWIVELPPSSEILDQLSLELNSFLGRDAYLWLASCAVYPKLHWDLALYLGYAVLDADDVGEHLPKIFRLPWFRQGAMPDWLRKRLISDLNEREEQVRNSLYMLLGTSLSNDNGLVLDIARRKGLTEDGFWHYSWHNLRLGATRWTERLFVRDFLRAQPPDSEMRDHVFLSFMCRTGQNNLVFRIPRALRDVFVHSNSNDQITLVLYSIMSTLFVAELATSIYARSLFSVIANLIVAFLFFYGDKPIAKEE